MKAQVVSLLGAAMLLSGSLSFAATGKAAETKAADKAPAAAEVSDSTIVELEKSVWQAFKDKNADAFKKSFAPGYQGVYSDGFMAEKDELGALKKSTLKSFDLKDPKVTRATKTSALITAKVTVEGSMGDKDISGTYNTSSLWVKRGDKYLTLLHTEVKAKEEKAK